MAIDFTTSPGGMYPRIGRILHVAYLLSPFETSLPAAFLDVFNQFLTSLEPVGSQVELQADTLTRVPSGLMGFATTAATGTIQGMVLADQPSQSGTLLSSLNEVIRQMKIQGKTVQASAIAITPTQLTGSVGTGVLVTSTKRGDGLVQENSIQETLRLVCTADAYTGGATQGQEQFGLTGSPATAGVWDYDYPTGSGASVSTRAISADQDASSSGNLLTNGNFELWTPSTPDAPTNALNNWTLGSPSAWGTDLAQDATVGEPLGGTYCLRLIPGTGVNTKLYQVFGDGTNGTVPTPLGLNSYAVNLWLRKQSGTVTAGVLTVELVDDTGTVTQDAQGLNNSFTVTLSTLTTSYVAYNGLFRLNATPPATIWLRLRVSTALTGASVLVDNVCMCPLTACYQGGPGFAVFSNALVPFVSGDGWNLAVTNDEGGASYLATFQSGFDRLFGMKAFNLLLPSSGSPNISNALITA